MGVIDVRKWTGDEETLRVALQPWRPQGRPIELTMERGERGGEGGEKAFATKASKGRRAITASVTSFINSERSSGYNFSVEVLRDPKKPKSFPLFCLFFVLPAIFELVLFTCYNCRKYSPNLLSLLDDDAATSAPDVELWRLVFSPRSHSSVAVTFCVIIFVIV